MPKIKSSKGKVYLSIAAVAAVLMMSLNANLNANASIFSNIQNADDIGQSLECVIIVVGCDAVGSVGSSGDVIVDSGDNNTSNGGGDDPLTCEECFEENLTPAQLQILINALEGATLADLCVTIMEDPTILVDVEEFLLGVGVDAEVVAEIIACIEAALEL